MNSTQSATTALQDISEKFKRKMRLLGWEALDEGVVLFFRLQSALETLKQTVQMAPIGSLHLLANR